MRSSHVKFYQTGTFTVGNRLLSETERSVQSTMERTNSLNSGHRACQGCGEALAAREELDIDIVCGIPDSGIAHGIGYASAAGIPYRRPFVKYTPTWPRSFMPQNQAVRDLVGYSNLGMDSTWWEILEPPPAGVPDRAHQFLEDIDVYAFAPYYDLYGGGGVVSTVGDLARFHGLTRVKSAKN